MASTKLYTADDLIQLDDECRYDLIRGELIQMTPAGWEHGTVALRIGRFVGNYVAEYGLGDVGAAETGFILARDPDVVLAPDVSFVRADRLPPEEERIGFLELPPDLVVEVVSPSDRLTNVADKVKEYLDAGVQLVWLVEPRRQRVTVYTQDQNYLILSVDDVLDGGDVLPGFRLPLADIFDYTDLRKY